MPTLPPILMQVEDPSILTKPGPYSAQGLTAFGRSGSEAGLPCFGSRTCCADPDDAESSASAVSARRKRFLISPFYRCAGAFATAPGGWKRLRDGLPARTNVTIRSRAAGPLPAWQPISAVAKALI